MSARGPGKRCGHSIDTLWEQPAVAATSPLPPYKPPAGMSAPLPRVKVYGEPAAAFAVHRPSIDRWQIVYLASFAADQEGDVWLTNEEVSGPGWQNAAIVPLPAEADPLNAAAEMLDDAALLDTGRSFTGHSLGGTVMSYRVMERLISSTNADGTWWISLAAAAWAERHQSGTVRDG